jgi:hypothetical protein
MYFDAQKSTKSLGTVLAACELNDAEAKQLLEVVQRDKLII